MSSKDIFQSFLNTYNSFVVTVHANPDPDALGSAVALYRYLNIKNKKVQLVLDAKIPANLHFLLADLEICDYQHFNNLNNEYQATIALDCSNKQRTNTSSDHAIWKLKVLNIDHHPDNTSFGDHNIVNKKASATGEILYDIFNTAIITKEIARAIYVALIGDTGGFRYGNTSPKVLQIAATLLEFDLDVAYLNTQVLEKQTKKAFNLVSDSLSSVKFFNNVATIQVDNKLLKKHDIDPSQLPELVNYIRSIEGVEIAVLYLEAEKDFTKISFRSQPQIDISAVAKHFGGGGHKNAAGCKMKGDFLNTIEKVNAQIKQYIMKDEN